MSRKARKIAETNTYHVVIRGMDRQIMFEESKDFIKYLDLLSVYKTECGFEIFAYCLMNNHVHLVIRSNNVPLSLIFSKLNTHYACWFNMKYQRTGHLQQERFYSEPIEDISYLLACIRYNHRNPCNAGLETAPGQSYLWSSYFDYQNGISDLVDIDFILSFMPKNDFLAFNNLSADDDCLDIDKIRCRLPDDVAKEIICEISKCSTSTEFQNLPSVLQNKYICEILGRKISIRQLNRLVGIPRGVIQRTWQKRESYLI